MGGDIGEGPAAARKRIRGDARAGGLAAGEARRAPLRTREPAESQVGCFYQSQLKRGL